MFETQTSDRRGKVLSIFSRPHPLSSLEMNTKIRRNFSLLAVGILCVKKKQNKAANRIEKKGKRN